MGGLKMKNIIISNYCMKASPFNMGELKCLSGGGKTFYFNTINFALGWR